METKANYVAVGAFVLACVVGLVVTIMWLAGAQYSQEYAYYQAYFKGPVTGLGKGTLTRYNGIEVGRITSSSFVEISGGTAKAPLLVAREGQRYPVIRTKQSTFAQLAQSAPEVVA